MQILGVRRGTAKTRIVLGDEPGQPRVRHVDRRDPGQPQFLHQPILQRAERALHPAFGLRAVGIDDATFSSDSARPAIVCAIGSQMRAAPELAAPLDTRRKSEGAGCRETIILFGLSARDVSGGFLKINTL